MIMKPILLNTAICVTLGLGVSCALAPPLVSQQQSTSQASASPTNSSFLQLAREYNTAHNGVSLLVMVDGEIVYEDYSNGGSADRASWLASGTKSFTGAMAAAAVEDGLLSWDEKISDTLTEWKVDSLKSQITVRQLLTLTSGLETTGARQGIPGNETSISRPGIHPPGEKFQYGPEPFQVFGELMRRKLAKRQETPLEYLERRIFKPIGLQVSDWDTDDQGNLIFSSGLYLTARNWAKFGELIRQNGTWGETKVLRSDLLKENFVGTAANPAYGLSWWLNEPVTAQQKTEIRQLRSSDIFGSFNLPDDLVMAAGAGQQRLFISPERKLVVVRQTNRRRPGEQGQQGGLRARGRRNGGQQGGLRARERRNGGQQGRYSDSELLSRLLYGTDASGRTVQLGEVAESTSTSSSPSDNRSRVRQRLRERFDVNQDGVLDEGERSAIRDFIRRRRRGY